MIAGSLIRTAALPAIKYIQKFRCINAQVLHHKDKHKAISGSTNTDCAKNSGWIIRITGVMSPIHGLKDLDTQKYMDISKRQVSAKFAACAIVTDSPKMRVTLAMILGYNKGCPLDIHSLIAFG